METLTKQTVSLLRVEIQTAFNTIAERHSLKSFKLPGTIRFNANGFRFLSELCAYETDQVGLTSDKVKLLRADIQGGFDAIALKNGILSIKMPATIRYLKTGFNFRSQLTLNKSDQSIKNVVDELSNMSDFDKAKNMILFSSLGLPSDILGKRLFIQNSIYTVASYHANRPAYPFVALRFDGKKYKMSIDLVKKGKPV
jgi:hypothetical protein